MKAEVRNRLEAPVDFARAQRLMLGLAASAVGVACLILQGPELQFSGHHWASVGHLLLELAAVAMATHVISMAWSGLSHSASAAANPLIFCFCVVAGADLFHFLGHDVIQLPIVAANEMAATWYWLAGCVFQFTAMVLLLLRANLPGPRSLWLQTGLLTVVVLTFGARDVASDGAALGTRGEFALLLTLGSLGIAGGLWRRFLGSQELSHLWLALGSFLSGLSILIFWLYGPTIGRADMVSDLLRLASYACIHRAVFVDGFQGPLRRLIHSEKAVREREAELNNILENLPAGLCRLDEQLNFRYTNENFREVMHTSGGDLPGQSFATVVPEQHLPTVRKGLERALSGNRIELHFALPSSSDGPGHHRHVVLAPARRDDRSIDGVLAIVSDVSDRENALRQAADAAQQTLELKAALDAHAIVAVTDARGVIMRVNDKFCSISQYGREELIGKTHRIINSGHHPKGFFAEMWNTIARGEVWSGEVCNRAKGGALYWVHTTIVPLLGADGRPAQYIAIRADITKRKEAEAEAQRMALHDVLTGLPNRRLMGDRLAHALATAQRERQHGALLFLDLDNFKDVNDSLGHPVGDQLLQQVAVRIAECVRMNDTVARLGGDEFVVILERLGPTLKEATAHALNIGSHIREELDRPFNFANHTVDISSSIGVVLFGDRDEEPDELVKQADMALYKAKEEGRNRLAFFDPQLQAEINARTELLKALRGALARDELRLFYQPVVDTSMRMVGVEALIRWQQERIGLVSPAQFIPLAEQSGLIIPIGDWVLRTACMQLKAWEDDEVRRDWTIAVNVSARQFHDDQFVSRVLKVLHETKAPADRLRIEITESMMQANVEQTIVTMQTLRSLGVLFSLDDFGTGYSSLSYLKRLPLDQLKIDRSFVADVDSDPNDAAIVQTVLSLAKHLALQVVAEGVETVEQQQLLLSYGCHAFQGYLFGKPVPVANLGNRIASAEVALAVLEKASR